MDDELLEKIDSLWFFSSVLRPSSHLTTQNSEISKRRPESTDAEKQNQEEQEQTMEKEIAGPEKIRETSRGRKSKNRVQKCIQQSSPQIKLEERKPFAVLYDCQMRNRERRNEQVGIESQFRHLTMPLTRDDLAMKAKLRSWAYAVACSVR